MHSKFFVIVYSESNENRDAESQLHAYSVTLELNIDPTELNYQFDTQSCQNDMDTFPELRVVIVFRCATAINLITNFSTTLEEDTTNVIDLSNAEICPETGSMFDRDNSLRVKYMIGLVGTDDIGQDINTEGDPDVSPETFTTIGSQSSTKGPEVRASEFCCQLDAMLDCHLKTIDQKYRDAMETSLLTDKCATVSFGDGDATSFKFSCDSIKINKCIFINNMMPVPSATNAAAIDSNLQKFIEVCAQINDKIRQEYDNRENDARAEQMYYAKMCTDLKQKFTAVFHIDAKFPQTTTTQEDRIADFSTGIHNGHTRLMLTLQMGLYHNGVFSLSCASDLRVHITGILYDSGAAPVSIVVSIGGCVSTTTTKTAPTTTATSTNAAPTTTTTRRQLLLAEFLSGG